jgi:hypothetical protein
MRHSLCDKKSEKKEQFKILLCKLLKMMAHAALFCTPTGVEKGSKTPTFFIL